jgi:hypothetical protein
MLTTTVTRFLELENRSIVTELEQRGSKNRQDEVKQKKRIFALICSWQRDFIECSMFVKAPRKAFQDRRLQPLGYSSAVQAVGKIILAPP